MAARPAWCGHRRQRTRRHRPNATAALTPRPFELQPFAQEPAGDKGGVRAGVDDLMQVAVVVDVVVADTHPTHVVASTIANRSSRYWSRWIGQPVSTTIGSRPRITIEFVWTVSG